MDRRLITILVVDDEPLVRHTLDAGLKQHGFHVLQAGDGDEALDVLGRAEVDVLLTDLAMPRREGMETIIEARRRFPDVKIVALSGVFGGLYLDMARQLGAAAALSKPVRMDVLRSTINAVLMPRASDGQHTPARNHAA
jgi:DNA-binding NarL/FixJ family response regulator